MVAQRVEVGWEIQMHREVLQVTSLSRPRVGQLWGPEELPAQLKSFTFFKFKIAIIT